MEANIGWLFWKEYFKDIDYNNLNSEINSIKIQKKVQNIINRTPHIEQKSDANILGNTHFQALTTYPGLILGSGNIHALPSNEGQAILGFHFDYTSGLPIIAGSSIKGVLRSAFAYKEYIKEVLSKESIDIESLEKEIFENGDIFHDATIIKADKFNKILGDDFLAPHGDNPLKNPTPLRFIKVLADVTFRFDFHLSDGIISKELKLKLFQQIIKNFGLGAKTNVGYGNFENFNPFRTHAEIEQEKLKLEKRKEQERKDRENERKSQQEQKAQKAKNGLDTLSQCKTVAEAFKLLKDSFGKVPKLTLEQKTIVEQYYKKQKNLSKSDEKVFKKYLK